MLKVKKIRDNVNELKYGSPLASGFDVRAYECVVWHEARKELFKLELQDNKWKIPPQSTVIFKTGYAMACNESEEIQARARSGFSLKTPMRISNGIGTIDEDFRGEIGIIMDNISNYPWFVEFEERVAQCVVCPIHRHNIVEVEELDETVRGEGGYGSTGTK